MCITAEFIYWLEFVVETSCLILIIDRALPADYSHLPSYAKTPDLYIEHLTSLHAQLSKVHVILLVVIGFVVNKYQSCTIPGGLPDIHGGVLLHSVGPLVGGKAPGDDSSL